ncbi:phosphate acyltransferase PlsX [bacterium]|nr:phosphate acyltransferase PlsX [bacterium]
MDTPNSQSTVRIALDVMSGDLGPEAAVEAARLALAAHDDLYLTLVGQPHVVDPACADLIKSFAGRVDTAAASEVVTMDELPSKALRGKKDSSIRVAINRVKSGDADAAVSAGNTGAVMATARFVLKTLPGIDRPAILSEFPSIRGHTHVLDLGANAECSAQQLYQFAVMGAVVARAVNGIERPSIALLNIGEEEMKGNEIVREAAQLLSASALNYVGFAEGNDVFMGDIDVIVADGFTGNVAMKSSEGAAKLIGQLMREEFTRSWFAKCCAAAAAPVLKAFARRIDPGLYNGASFVGLNGTVVKSHGSADAPAFANAIRIAMIEARKDVPRRISDLLAETLASEG